MGQKITKMFKKVTRYLVYLTPPPPIIPTPRYTYLPGYLPPTPARNLGPEIPTPHPDRQSLSCENITLLQVRWRTVEIQNVKPLVLTPDTQTRVFNQGANSVITTRKRSCGKVMFLLSVWGVSVQGEVSVRETPPYGTERAPGYTIYRNSFLFLTVFSYIRCRKRLRRWSRGFRSYGSTDRWTLYWL